MTTVIVGTVGCTGQSAMADMNDVAKMFNWNDFSDEQLATIKVNMNDAITNAKDQQDGTVIGAQLEKEDGKFVYEISFIDKGKEKEVMVDALSGQVFFGKE